MLYDKKIKYLDYLENGERIRGGGFAKVEIWEQSLKIELTVRGLRDIRNFWGDVFLCGTGREETLGKIQIEEGQGTFRRVYTMQADGSGFSRDELSGLRIPLGESREIVCTWKSPDVPVKKADRQDNRQRAADGEESVGENRIVRDADREITAQENNSRKTTVRAKVGKREEEQKELPVGTMLQETAKQQQTARQQETAEQQQTARQQQTAKQQQMTEQQQTARQQARTKEESKRQPATVTLLEDKWLQLSAIYPHVKPFRDEREYLSIGPADFVLFPAESYKAVNNSFMLHGYYNYRHLILARDERRGETVYYVGVPGNYYDREKQVAIMFGFESFECAQEPAQEADFGYYMMRVLL